jgi:hypothetical protein
MWGREGGLPGPTYSYELSLATHSEPGKSHIPELLEGGPSGRSRLPETLRVSSFETIT